MLLVLFWSWLCPVHWSQVLSLEWRCSWSSASHIWVIKNFIAFWCASYIRDLMVLICPRLKLCIELIWTVFWEQMQSQTADGIRHERSSQQAGNNLVDMLRPGRMANILWTTFSTAFSFDLNWKLFWHVQLTISNKSVLVSVMVRCQTGNKTFWTNDIHWCIYIRYMSQDLTVLINFSLDGGRTPDSIFLNENILILQWFWLHIVTLV